MICTTCAHGPLMTAVMLIICLCPVAPPSSSKTRFSGSLEGLHTTLALKFDDFTNYSRQLSLYMIVCVSYFNALTSPYDGRVLCRWWIWIRLSLWQHRCWVESEWGKVNDFDDSTTAISQENTAWNLDTTGDWRDVAFSGRLVANLRNQISWYTRQFRTKRLYYHVAVSLCTTYDFGIFRNL